MAKQEYRTITTQHKRARKGVSIQSIKILVEHAAILHKENQELREELKSLKGNQAGCRTRYTL